MAFAGFSEQTAITFPNSINKLVLETEMRCVFCEVEAEFLNSIKTHFVHDG
jgi:hypothetical protein